ncbi:MAG TPA: phosphoenolpyruvate--protein phosphotransferase [Acetobacteraceae bacterium]|nr:phosphoenolpyruvate--protein phosphotransferase [Acetobacteraceae bacterium]
MNKTEPPPPQHKRLPERVLRASTRGMSVHHGIPVSAGVAIGPVFTAAEPELVVTRFAIADGEAAQEMARLEDAITRSRRQLAKLQARLAVLPEDSQGEIGPLIEAYVRMLADSRLIRGARRRIADHARSAEAAVSEEAEAIAAAIMAQAEPGMPREDRASLQRRADEVREISRRLVRNLTRAPFRSFAGAPEGAVLVAEVLRPSDAALLDPTRLTGVATEEGGAEGHTAVMLRALGLPAVLGAAGLAHAAKPGDVVIVDGGRGTVTLNPDAAALAAARRAVTAFARERQRFARLRSLPAETSDGEEVELQANMELPLELPLIQQSGAHGIGLLRTEFLFMNRETVPDEDTQTDTYRAVLEAMGGRPVTIRVLDWGGEKEIEALSAAGVVPEIADMNPAFGMRGIRLLLRRPELFETQLAAIFRAAVAGEARVMLPMVTHIAEVRAAREVYERVARRLRRRGERIPERLPPLGIMVETPGAALSADALALEADFFAIGTNDLTAYTLAVDRGDSAAAELYDPLHPAVLRLVQFATEAALRMRMPVSVCGEIAADPRLTPLLLGLGIRSFSMNPSAVPRVKQAVRAVSIDDCVRRARRVMEQSDPAKIREMLEQGAPAEI